MNSTQNGTADIVSGTAGHEADDEIIPDGDAAADILDVYDTGISTEEFESKLDHKARLSRRPGRKHQLADGFKKNKVVNEVLDKPTVMTLYRMISGGILSGVNGSVSAGKESLVFWALDAEAKRDIALKIYLVSTSNFKRRQSYIDGDPRFASVKRGTRNIIYLWAKKEFRNLTQCANAGIPVPMPIHVANNVLAMEFIGSNDQDSATRRPALQLIHSTVDRNDYLEAVSIITDMYRKANLVHGDYSEYNIFKTSDRGLVVFDLGSAVDKRHPNSKVLLWRDIENITRFFKKRGVSTDDPRRIMEDLIQ